MICPVCKQRWAQLKNEGIFSDPTSRVREEAFKSNKIQCCGYQKCLDVIDMVEWCVGLSYDKLVEETKKELSEGKIKQEVEMVVEFLNFWFNYWIAAYGTFAGSVFITFSIVTAMGLWVKIFSWK